MKGISSDIDDPKLKARVCDIIWTRRRKGHFEYVKVAITAYLNSARRILEAEKIQAYLNSAGKMSGTQSITCADRVERAFDLASSLKQAPLIDPVIRQIEETISNSKGDERIYICSQMMRILLKFGTAAPAKYASLAGELAKETVSTGAFHQAREFLSSRPGDGSSASRGS